MFYTYHIQSLKYPSRDYIGFTSDLRQRLKDHNAGRNRYTAPFRPWEITFYASFRSEQKARDFESYLKTNSGKAFASKRLW